MVLQSFFRYNASGFARMVDGRFARFEFQISAPALAPNESTLKEPNARRYSSERRIST